MQNFGVTNHEHYGMLWYFLLAAKLREITTCMLTRLTNPGTYIRAILRVCMCRNWTLNSVSFVLFNLLYLLYEFFAD